MKKKFMADMISPSAKRAASPSKSSPKNRNGVPLLRRRKDVSRVTSKLVHQLREELS